MNPFVDADVPRGAQVFVVLGVLLGAVFSGMLVLFLVGEILSDPGGTQGALLAIAFGLLSWLSLEYNYQETDFWPPQLVGLLLSALGMIVGSLLPQVIGVRPQSAALGADAQRA